MVPILTDAEPMNTAPAETTEEPRFLPGSFVHPAQLPGHLAHVLMVVAPEAVNQHPVIGCTYAVIVCPQFSLPADFLVLPPPMQEFILRRLEAVRLVRNDSLITAEDAGLKLVSEEWLACQEVPAVVHDLETGENVVPDAEDDPP